MTNQASTPAYVAEFSEAADHLADVLAFHYPQAMTGQLAHPMALLEYMTLDTLHAVTVNVIDALPVSRIL